MSSIWYMFVWFTVVFAAVLPWMLLYFLYDEASTWWCEDSFLDYCLTNGTGRFLFVLAIISSVFSVVTIAFH